MSPIGNTSTIYHNTGSDSLGKFFFPVPVTSSSTDLEVLGFNRGVLLGGDKANFPLTWMFRLPTGLWVFMLLSQLGKQKVTGLGYWSRLSNTEIEPMVCAEELKRNSRFHTRGPRLSMLHSIALLVFNGVLNLDSSEYTGGTKKLWKSYRTFFITIARSAQETEGLKVNGGWLESLPQVLNFIAKAGREISCQCHSFGRQSTKFYENTVCTAGECEKIYHMNQILQGEVGLLLSHGDKEDYVRSAGDS